MRPAPDLTGWITTKQAADVLVVTPLRITQLTKEGKLRAVMSPHGRLFDIDSVEALRLERAASVHRPYQRRTVA